MNYRSGQLRDKISLVTQVKTSDGMGGYSKNPQVIATPRAYVRQLSNKEQLQHQQLQLSRVIMFVVRRRSSPIVASMEINWDSRRYNIKSISPQRKIDSFVEIVAELING